MLVVGTPSTPSPGQEPSESVLHRYGTSPEHLPTDPSTISSDEQESVCRDFCTTRHLEPTITFRDPTGSTEELDALLALATSAEPPFDAIVVWKTRTIALSLEETIKYGDMLRKAGVALLSATKKAVDP